MPGSSFNSISLPIDANVSAKLKAKIWANEFLDFSLLLGSGACNTCYQLFLGPQNGSNIPVLFLQPTHKVKSIPNIEAWTSA